MNAFANRANMGTGIAGYCRAMLFSWPRLAINVLVMTLLILFISLLAPPSAYATTYSSGVQANGPPDIAADIATEDFQTVASADIDPEATVVSMGENNTLENTASDLQELENEASDQENDADDSTDDNPDAISDDEALDNNDANTDDNADNTSGAEGAGNDSEADGKEVGDDTEKPASTTEDSAAGTTDETTGQTDNQLSDQTADEAVPSDTVITAITTPDSQGRDYQSDATAETGANTVQTPVDPEVNGQTSSALDSGEGGGSNTNEAGSASAIRTVSATYALDSVGDNGASILRIYKTFEIDGRIVSASITAASATYFGAEDVYGNINSSGAGIIYYISATTDDEYIDVAGSFASIPYVFLANYDFQNEVYRIQDTTQKFIYLGTGELVIGLHIDDLDNYDSDSILNMFPELIIPGFQFKYWYVDEVGEVAAGELVVDNYYYDEDAPYYAYAKYNPQLFTTKFLYDLSQNKSKDVKGFVTASGDFYDDDGDEANHYLSDSIVIDDATIRSRVQSTIDGYEFLGWAYKPYSTDEGDVFTLTERRTSGANNYYLKEDMESDAMFLPTGGSIPVDYMFYSAKNGVYNYQELSDLFTDGYYELYLYPVWGVPESDDYTVTFNNSANDADRHGTLGDDTTKTVSKDGGRLESGPSYTADPGYLLYGWTKKGESQVYTDVTTIPISADTELYAVWHERSGYTVTYEIGQSAREAEVTCKSSDSNLSWTTGVSLPTPSTWGGHTFEGWYLDTDTNFENQITGSTYGALAIDANQSDTVSQLKLVAKWGSKKYKVYYNTNGGLPTTLFTYGYLEIEYDGYIQIPTNTQITKAGYTSQGWYYGNDTTRIDGSNKKYSDYGNASDGSSITIDLHWKEDVVTITYKIIETGATISHTSESGTGDTVVDYVGAATGDLYTNANGTAKKTSGATNVSDGVTPAFVKSGDYPVYEIVGWYTDENYKTAAVNAGTSPTFVPSPTSNVYVGATYYLHVEPKKFNYVIEYYEQNLEGTDYVLVTHGHVQGDGYDGNNKAEYRSTVTVSGWSLTGATVVTPASRPGFTYNADVTASEGAGLIQIDFASSAQSAPDSNTLKLYYTRDSYGYNISYNSVGSGFDLPALTADHKDASVKKIKYDDTVRLSAVPTKTGYTWKGWTGTYGNGRSFTINNDLSAGTATFSMPAGAITLTGVWEAIPYYVKVMNDGTHGDWGSVTVDGNTVGNDGITKRFNYGDKVTGLVATPKDDNYYFLGFQYTNGTVGGGNTNARTTNPASLALTVENFTFDSSNTVVLTARWDQVIIYVYDDGSAKHGNFGSVSSNKLTSGNIPSYTSLGGTKDTESTNYRNSGKPKAQPGYTFVGWNIDEDATPDTADGWLFADYSSTTLADSSETRTRGADALYTGKPIDRSRTFYAVFAPTTQTITFSTSSADNVTGTFGDPSHATTTATTGSTISVPDDLAKPGYTLTGWTYVDEKGKSHPVSLTTGNPATVLIGSGVEDSTNHTYTYTFIPVFAQSKVTYTYSFATGCDGMGSLTPTSEEIYASTGTASGSTAAGKDGQYDFVGWYSDPNHTAESKLVTNDYVTVNGATIIPKKVNSVYSGGTFYAYFVPVQHQVTIKIDTVNDNHGTLTYTISGNPQRTGATEYPVQDYDYGTKITDIINDARLSVVPNTGYTRTEWMVNNTKYSKLDNLIVSGPMTITPVFSEIDYTVTYTGNGSTPKLDSITTTTKWSNTVAPNTTISRTGYTFAGWYVDSGLTQVVGSGSYDETFASAVAAYETKNGANSFSGTNIHLYVKWEPKSGYTVIYDATRNATGGAGTAGIDYPTGITNPDNLTPVTWETANLVPDLTAPDGWVLDGWYLSTTEENKITSSYITSSTTYGDKASGNDAANSSISLFAHWTRVVYTVNYMDGSTQLYSETGYWDTLFASGSKYDKKPSGGTDKYFKNWLYYTSGGQNPTSSAVVIGTTRISDVALNNPANTTLTLRADWGGNTPYTVYYYKINRDSATGNYVVSDNPEGDDSGYVSPSDGAVSVDNLKSTNGTTYNYWTYFTDFGYAPDTTNKYATSITSFPASANDGSTNRLEFKLYYYEKVYTIKYDTGVNGLLVSDRTVGWNESPITPTTEPVRPGYNAPTWKYNGTTVGSSASVKSLLHDAVTDVAGGDDGLTLTLVADWTVAQATLSFSARAEQGTAPAVGGNVAPSVSQTVDAIGQTPTSVVATVTDNTYKLLGWYYNDGTNDVPVVSNPDDLSSLTLTLVAGTDSAPLVDRTYFARFAPRSSLDYTIEHYYMDTSGHYGTSANVTANGSGLEGATVLASTFAITSNTGLTYDPDADGHINVIILQADDEDNRTLKLYYKRDSYKVTVNPYAANADHPDADKMPTITIPDALKDEVYYGATVQLPTVGSHEGWTLIWKVDNYNLAANDTTFTVPHKDGDTVTLTGVWTRVNRTVKFWTSATYQPPATEGVFGLYAKNGGSLTTTVPHGKTLADTTYDYKTTVGITNPSNYALVGWKVLSAADDSELCDQISDPSQWLVTENTVFVPQWKKIYTITYFRGDHAADGTLEKHQFGPYTSTETELPGWNGMFVDPDTSDGNTSVDYRTDADQPAAANGYAFVGWTWSLTDDEGTKNYVWYVGNVASIGGKMPTLPDGVITSAMPTQTDKNYGFTAIYAALPRTLVFTLPAGEGDWTNAEASHSVDSFTGETVTAGIPVQGDVNRAGYKLVGWKVSGSSDTTSYTAELGYTIPEIVGDTITFVPEWETTSVQIKYEIIKGTDGLGHGSRTGNGSETVQSDATQTTGSTAKADPGYKFDGWYLDAAGTQKIEGDSYSGWVTGNDDDGWTLKPKKVGAEWTGATYYAKFVPGDASYTVWYYLQNVGLDGYTHNATDATYGDVTVTKHPDNSNVKTGDTVYVADNLLASTPGFEHPEDNADVDTQVVVLATGQTVLKVYYNRLKYNVHFTFTGVDNPPSVTDLTNVVYGSTVTLPTPTLTGHKLSWSAEGDTSHDAVGISSGTFTMPAENVTVTGTWSVKDSYTVNYVTNGDTTVEPRPTTWTATDLDKDANGDAYAPTKKGYKFLGWTYGSGVDYNATPYSTVAGNDDDVDEVTLTAKWQAKSYGIVFDGNGATSGSMGNQTVTFDTLPVAFNATGYELSGKRFRGWDTNPNADPDHPEFTTQLTRNLVEDIGDDPENPTTATLYAIWGDVSYTVHYNTDGGSAIDDRTNVNWNATDLNTDGASPTPTTHAPTKTGYTFSGWTYGDNVDYEPGTTAYSTIAVNDDVYEVTLKAKWTPNTYTVTYRANGGVGDDYTQTLTYDKSEALAPNTFTRAGYNFLGWSAESAATTATYGDGQTKVFNLATAQGADVALFAIWEELGYRVVYNTDGGSTVADRTGVKWETAGLDTNGTTAYAPTKTGYDFDGWSIGNTDTKYSGQTYGAIAVDDTVESITLKAIWKNKVFHVVFAPGFDAKAEGDVWNQYPTGGTTYEFDRYQSNTADTTSNAIAWTDTGWLPMKLADQTAALTPTRAGYDFAGWVYGASGKALTAENNATVSFADLADGNDMIANGIVTITATWTPRTYHVVYKDAHNGALMSETAKDVWTGEWYDNATAGSLTGTKSGWTFVGWTTDLAGSNPFTTGMYYSLGTEANNPGMAYAPDADKTNTSSEAPTLYAQWKKNVGVSIQVFKEDEGGNLLTDAPVATIDLNNKSWTSYEGQNISASTADGKVTVTGNNADNLPFTTADVPTLMGYELDLTKSTLSLANLTDGDARTLVLAYKPKTASDDGVTYKVRYLNPDGSSTGIADKVVTNWASTGLAPDTTPTKLGYKLDGYGWKDANGNVVTATTPYYQLAVNANGDEDDSITPINMYIQWLLREYHINYIDATDSNGNGLSQAQYKYIRSSKSGKGAETTSTLHWTDSVDLYDIDTASELGSTNHQTGWKFLGWALSPLAAQNKQFVSTDVFNALFSGQNSGIDEETLATYDIDSASEGLNLYAAWAKYVPYTVKYFTTDADGSNKAAVKDANGNPVTVVHGADGKDAWLDGTVTISGTDITGYRPAGYEKPADSLTSDQLASENAADNVIEVVYKQINDFVLRFDRNAPGATADDIIENATITNLIWTSKSYNDADATPQVQGHTLNGKASRWNTKRDGGGLTFAADTTYGQIAEAIAAALENAGEDFDLYVRENGLTLYAQYSENADYKVVYDLNNVKDGVRILTDVPSTSNPIDVSTLTRDPVTWSATGFNNDSDLDAAPRGYEFAGWNTKADGKGMTVLDTSKFGELYADAYGADEQAKKSVTLYAQWKEVIVEIVYTTDGNGSINRVVDKISAVTGTPVSDGSSSGTKLTSKATANPGYHFVKWILVSDGTDAANGGGSLSGQSLSAMAVDDAKNITSVSDQTLKVTNASDGVLHAATYQAVFEANPAATITYDMNGGTGSVASVTQPFGSLPVLSDGTGAKRPYYTLKGWNTKADGSGTLYALGATDYVLPEGGETLYAMWEPNTYTVTIEGGTSGGGKVKSVTETVPYNGTISTSTLTSAGATPDSGKILTGWRYTMTDAETGEVITGIVKDPSQLKIVGPVTFSPVFEVDPKLATTTGNSDSATTRGMPGYYGYGYYGVDNGRGGTLAQTGERGNGLIALVIAMMMCSLIVGLVAQRRRTEASGNSPGPGSTRRTRRSGSLLIAAAVAVVIATGASMVPGQAFAQGNDGQVAEVVATASDNIQATNSEAESSDSASELVSDTNESAVEAERVQACEEQIGSDEQVPSETVESEDEQINEQEPVLTEDEVAQAPEQIAELSEGDAVDEQKPAVSKDNPSKGEKVEKADEKAKNTKSAETVIADEIADQNENAEALDEEVKDDDIQETTTGEEIVETTTDEQVAMVLSAMANPDTATKIATSEGQFYLKEYDNANIVLGVANSQITTSSKTAAGVSNHWNIDKVSGEGDDALYTIKCGDLYLAYENSELVLAKSAGEESWWKIASYTLNGNTVIAIYHASISAILGISGDVSHKPFCSAGNVSEYPALPASGELRWTIEYVQAMPWTITFDANGGTGTMGTDNVITVEGGKSSPALTNTFTKPGYSFVKWIADDGTTYANGATINRELYVTGFNLNIRADWREDTVKVTYAASTGGAVKLGTSGAAGSSVSETVGAEKGIVVGTASQTFAGSTAVANSGYHFTGWSVSGVPSGAAKSDLDSIEKASNTIPGSTVSKLSMAADNPTNTSTYHPLSFTSSFAANTYTVNYDSNGGSGELAASSTKYGSNNVQAGSSGVSRAGYTLSGWNTEADGTGVAVAAGAVLSASTLDRIISSGKLSGSTDDATTLYAQWKAVPAPVVVPTTPETVPDEKADDESPAPAEPAPEAVLPIYSGQLAQNTAEAAEAVATATTETATKVAEEVLEVAAVSSTPIVTAGATGASGDLMGESGGGSDLAETFANMTSAEKVQVAGNVVTAVAAVSALAGLLGVGASVVGAFAAGLVGIAGTAGATGAADLAAELAAASAATGAAGRRGRRRARAAAAADDNDDDENEED